MRYRVAALTVVTALLMPLLLTRYAPLVDYPNHLARTFILRHYAEVPSFAAGYTRSLAPIPNVAMDAIVVALEYVFPPVLAGKVFLLAIVLLWCAGCHLLGRAIHDGRPTWLALPCMLLAYHGPFQYGFVNYAFGLGVYFVGAAVWLSRRGRWAWGGLASATALALLAYLSHLSSYALFGVTAVVVTAYDVARRRVGIGQALLGGVPFVPPLVLFVLFMRGHGQVGQVQWNTLAGKGVALFSLVRGYDVRLDAVVAAALVVVTAAALFGAWRAGRLSADGACVVASVVLFALFLACPKDLFTSGGADVRVVPAAVVLGILAWRIDLPRRLGAPLLAAAVAVLLARTAAIAVAWSGLDARTAHAVALSERLPVGARVLDLFYPPDGADAAKRARVLEHAPYYAVITRQAFVPRLFASPAQQPLVAHEYVWGSTTRDALFDQHLDDFGYVWAYDPPPRISQRLHECCDSVAADVGVQLWRTRRSPQVPDRGTGRP